MADDALRQVAIAETRELRRRVLRPHQTLEEVAAGEPADAYAVAAFDGSQPVAVGLIAPSDGASVWRIRGMATEPAARGRGAGSRVLAELVRHAVSHGAERIWCNARTPALSLYARAGFQAASAEFELPDIGPHVVMELRPTPRRS